LHCGAKTRIGLDQSKHGFSDQLRRCNALITGNARQLRLLLRSQWDFHGQTVLQQRGAMSSS
jgi:hypothetical protein